MPPQIPAPAQEAEGLRHLHRMETSPTPLKLVPTWKQGEGPRFHLKGSLSSADLSSPRGEVREAHGIWKGSDPQCQ